MGQHILDRQNEYVNKLKNLANSLLFRTEIHRGKKWTLKKDLLKLYQRHILFKNSAKYELQ
mgnify:CR=1 FL=1